MISKNAVLAEAVIALRGSGAEIACSRGAEVVPRYQHRSTSGAVDALRPLMPIIYSTRIGARQSASLRMAVALARLYLGCM